jgi:peptide/nickel transport system substrate-binding protein
MNILQIVLLSSLLLSSPLLPCVLAAPPAIQRQMEIIEATIEGGSIWSVDPAAIYDTASAAILLQTHDTLICFDVERMNRYLPAIATEWTIKQNTPPIVSAHTRLNFYYTYYFKIRTGVQWQNPTFGTVTPTDVEYTFERGMVLEPGDNPQWMFYEPLLNGATMTYIDGHDVDPEGNLTERAWVGWAIDEAVESNSTHLWFNLAFPGVYAPFMQILSQQWSSIICKDWANSLGRPSNWNGDWGVDHTAYYAYHYPSGPPPLDYNGPAVMGSGPFELAHLDPTLHYWDVNRFTGYWRGWGSGPAPNYGVG